MKFPQHYVIEMQEVILFYNGLEVLTRQILDSKGAIPTKTTADAKHNSIILKVNEKVYAAQVGCEQCKGHHYTKDCPLKEEGKTLKGAYYTQFGVPFQRGGQYRAGASGFYQRNNANPSNQGASIKTLEIQIGQMSKVLQERGFRSLPSSIETNPRDHVKWISTIVEADIVTPPKWVAAEYGLESVTS
ncbi:homeodomain-like protein [Tanacetum coccineum]